MVIYYTKPQESLTVTSAHSSFNLYSPQILKKKKKAEFYRVDKVLNSTYHSSVPVPLFLAPITTI